MNWVFKWLLWGIVFAGIVTFIVIFCTVVASQSPNSSTPASILFSILSKPNHTTSGTFHHVDYYCPTIPPKTFQQMLAVESSTQKIISASNSYMTDELFIKGGNHAEDYESKYHIYQGLHNTYQLLTQNTQDQVVTIQEPMIMFSNSFTGVNSGHDLGNVLATLDYIHHNEHIKKDIKIGIQDLAFKFPRILELIELYYPQENWVILKPDTLYHFDQIDFVVVDPRYVIQNYQTIKPLIKDIVQKSIIKLANEGCQPPTQTNVILVKQLHNTSLRTHDAFHGANFFAAMNSKKWIILNPEFDSMYYMIALLHQAKNIIISFGSIAWTHMLFFNPQATITHLQIGDEVMYEPVRKLPKFNVIQMHDTFLDSDLNRNLIIQLDHIHHT